jgi:hypothetical protein
MFDSLWNPRPFILLHSTEAAADSGIRIHTLDAADASLRPYLRYYAHYAGSVALGFPTEAGGSPGTADFTIYASGPITNYGGLLQLGTITDSGSWANMLRYGDNAGNPITYWGLTKQGTGLSGDYPALTAHKWANFVRVPYLFDSLANYCIGDNVSDTAAIASAYIRILQVSNKLNTTEYLKLKGPVLQKWVAPTTAYNTFTNGTTTLSAKYSSRVSTDTVRWNDGSFPLGQSAGVYGDVDADYSVVSSKISTYDVGVDSTMSQNMRFATGVNIYLDITKFVKYGIAARVQDSVYHDTAGLSVWMVWVDNAGINTITVGANKGQAWYAMVNDTAICAAVIVNTVSDISSYCGAAPSGGQVIIIGMNTDAVEPTREYEVDHAK